jgi:hypothetical protein
MLESKTQWSNRFHPKLSTMETASAWFSLQADSLPQPGPFVTRQAQPPVVSTLVSRSFNPKLDAIHSSSDPGFLLREPVSAVINVLLSGCGEHVNYGKDVWTQINIHRAAALSLRNHCSLYSGCRPEGEVI